MIINQIKAKQTYVGRIWLLFASLDNTNWDCVQVAQSRENIQGEIKSAIKDICNDFSPSEGLTYTNSVFYENVCPVAPKKEAHYYLYSKIGNEYKYFKFYFLNVDNYLEIEPSNTPEIVSTS